jgi:hypothetical protein
MPQWLGLVFTSRPGGINPSRKLIKVQEFYVYFTFVNRKLALFQRPPDRGASHGTIIIYAELHIDSAPADEALCFVKHKDTIVSSYRHSQV